MLGLIGYQFSNNLSELKQPLVYVVAGNGTFEMRRNRLMIATRKLTDGGAPKLPDIVEGITLNIPKLPFSVFNTVVAFCKEVYERDITESTIMVFYNTEENSFKLWVPLQENSGVNSEYKRDDDPEYTKMCQENILVMVAHSHPWNGTPSPSGTDDKDEKESLLYMIVGNVKGVPTTYLSTCPGGERIRLPFFDVFNTSNTEISDVNLITLLRKCVADPELATLIAHSIPKEELVPVLGKHASDEGSIAQNYSLEGIEISEDWMKRCKKKTYQATTTRAHQNHQSVINWNEDPARQYAERTHGNYYDGHGEYQGYWWKDRIDEIDKKNSTAIQIGPGASGIANRRVDVRDVIDDVLDLDDKDVARLILVLKKEGYDDLIRLCINPQQQQNGGKTKKNKGGHQKCRP